MSQHIKTLIGNVLDKEFTSAKATFDALMSERLAVVMDEEEMKIAAKIYNDVDYDDLMAEAKKDDDSNGDSSSDDENDDEDDEDEEDEPKSKKKMKEALGADHETIGKIRRKAGTRLQGINRATARLEK